MDNQQKGVGGVASPRTRVDIMTFTADQVTRFTSALNVMKADGTYDDFIKKHMTAMMTPTPAKSTSNAAHSGPIFLAWHRATLWEFETALLAVEPTLPGLPYWRWEKATTLNGGAPQKSKLWSAAYLGTDGDPANGDRVLNGPFANWNALIYNSATGGFVVRSTPGLVRRLGRDPAGMKTLPTDASVTDVMSYTDYDVAPWGQSTSSFRSRLEGWNGGPRMHNQVHRWVGGDMLVGTSPNDPVFWLNHANVDRLWWTWQTATTPIRGYQPTAATGPVGQRSTDLMKFLGSTTWTPAQVLDIGGARLGYQYA